LLREAPAPPSFRVVSIIANVSLLVSMNPENGNSVVTGPNGYI
jgi:hypothetical protein